MSDELQLFTSNGDKIFLVSQGFFVLYVSVLYSAKGKTMFTKDTYVKLPIHSEKYGNRNPSNNNYNMLFHLWVTAKTQKAENKDWKIS